MPRLALALLLLALPLAADEPANGNMRIDSSVDLKATGDATTHMVFDYSADDFAAKRAATPNAMDLMHNMASHRCDFEVASDMSCRYDDATSAMVMDFTEVGAVKLHGATWEISVGAGPEYITQAEQNGRTVLFFYDVSPGGEGKMSSKGQAHYLCPPGAKGVAFDKASASIRYTLDLPDTGKPGALTGELKVKARLMTCIYKVYGLGTDFSAMWIAKALLKNTGEGRVKDLRVRYRLSGYSEWCMWHKIAEVVPGQTIVDVWYPVLDKSVAAIHANTPADLEMEWKYDDGTGKEKEDNDAKRIILLGGNEFVFSNLTAGETARDWQEGVNNAQYVAAWVTRDDPAVKQLAAMANKNAGGVGASENDENAIKVLRALYDIMLANDFTYQHPPSLTDRSISFDVQNVQNVKFPRDVIRDRSGTCIDLAICYAAMAHAVGLKPHLALIPGHCFPVIDLPGGNCLAVETTGVLGGIRFGSADFDKMTDYGKKELEDSRADGRIVMIDVQDDWTRGISNPELENLPPDILDRWHIVAERAGGTAPQPPTPVDPGANIDGSWSGKVQTTDAQGQPSEMTVEFSFQAGADGTYEAAMRIATQVASPDGPADVQLDETFTGKVENNELHLQGARCTRTVVATGKLEDLALDEATFGLKDGKLVGRVGNDKEGWTEVTLDKQ